MKEIYLRKKEKKEGGEREGKEVGKGRERERKGRVERRDWVGKREFIVEEGSPPSCQSVRYLLDIPD